MYFQNSLCHLSIVDCLFENNTATLFGGAIIIQISSGNLIFENNLFILNSVESEDFESVGGAIYASGYSTSILYFKDNKFLNNYGIRGFLLIDLKIRSNLKGAGISTISSNITEISSLYQGLIWRIVNLL